MTAVLLLLLCLGQASTPRLPASSEGTAEIRGRVTDRETGSPLPSAHISIAERTLNVTRSAVTDDAGIFRFRGLPPGRYDGIADPGQHRGSYRYEPLMKIEAGQVQYIELAKGETKEINVSLRRAVTIPVRVVDAFGEPLSDIRVSAYKGDTGHAVAVPFQQRTDDHGRLRVFGLEAGRYVLCAEPFGLVSDSGKQVRQRLVRTCYPSAEDEQQADVVTVGTAPVEEIEIRMRRERTYSVTGTLLDSAGMPAIGARVQLEARGGSSAGSVFIKDDGRFRADGVHAGTYVLQASVGGREQPEQRRPLEAAYVPIRVDTDLDNVAVTLSKTITIEGRIVLEDPSLPFPAGQGSGVMVSLQLRDDPFGNSGSPVYGYARDDHTFTLDGLFGRRVLKVHNVPQGWFAKEVRYRGKDIIDSVVDFSSAGEGTMDIVLSNRGASITGRVTDEDGRPAALAHVWLFRGAPDAGRGPTQEVAASASGEFTVAPLRSGDYTLVAFASRPWELKPSERDRAAKLAELGERITLVDLDQRTIDLRIVKEVPR